MKTLKYITILLLGVLLTVGLAACEDESKEAEYGVDELPEEASIENGERLFKEGHDDAPRCTTCHNEDGTDSSQAPGLRNYAERAGNRVEGETAEEYTLNSIIAPGKYIIDGYRNTMPPDYDEKLSKQQIADLVAYLLTLD
jgi:mono/diheme cytochrome c family protein